MLLSEPAMQPLQGYDAPGRAGLLQAVQRLKEGERAPAQPYRPGVVALRATSCNGAQPGAQAFPPPPTQSSPDPCWRCGGLMRKLQRGRTTQYGCSRWPYCGAMRKEAKQGEVVILQLKGHRLEKLALSMPRTRFQNKLPAFLKRRQLTPEAVVQKSKGIFEALFPLDAYDRVVQKLRSEKDLDVREVPGPTMAVATNRGGGLVFVDDAEIDERFARLPLPLVRRLLEFQKDGVRYALRRDGRCLIADEMGTGKTLQALAVMACYREDWPLLIIVPASMRLVWAEMAELWLPGLRPTDIHVILGGTDRLYEPDKRPPIVITSYHMIKRLQHEMGSWDWNAVILDESHNLTVQRKDGEAETTAAVVRLARKAKRIIMLSGTPSLHRPFDIFTQVNVLQPRLLGQDKWEFGRNYCEGIIMSKKTGSLRAKPIYNGCRFDEELHALLRMTVMIRRLKSEVLSQLPPCTRTVIRIEASSSASNSAPTTAREMPAAISEDTHVVPDTDAPQPQPSHEQPLRESGHDDGLWDDVSLTQAVLIREDVDERERGVQRRAIVRRRGVSKHHAVGRSKLKGAQEWLLERFKRLWGGGDDDAAVKHVIYAHHIDVLDGLQLTVQRAIEHRVSLEGDAVASLDFVRIDGSTPPLDRQHLVRRFNDDLLVKVAIIGVTAGGVGLDLSAASVGVFAELPPSVSWLRQAEDRIHRRGQESSVQFIYLVEPPGSLEDDMWQSMSRLLSENTAVINSREAAESLNVDYVMGLDGEQITAVGVRASRPDGVRDTGTRVTQEPEPPAGADAAISSAEVDSDIIYQRQEQQPDNPQPCQRDQSQKELEDDLTLAAHVSQLLNSLGLGDGDSVACPPRPELQLARAEVCADVEPLQGDAEDPQYFEKRESATEEQARCETHIDAEDVPSIGAAMFDVAGCDGPSSPSQATAAVVIAAAGAGAAVATDRPSSPFSVLLAEADDVLAFTQPDDDGTETEVEDDDVAQVDEAEFVEAQGNPPEGANDAMPTHGGDPLVSVVEVVSLQGEEGQGDDEHAYDEDEAQDGGRQSAPAFTSMVCSPPLTRRRDAPVQFLEELWFEVSRHTGRFYLHRAADGSEPMGFFINVAEYWDMAQEMTKAESASLDEWRRVRDKILAWSPAFLPPSLVLTLACKRLLLNMVSNYRQLNSRLRKQTFGRVVQPPVDMWLKKHPSPSVSSSAYSTRRYLSLSELLSPPNFSSVKRKVLLPLKYGNIREVYQPVDPVTRHPLCMRCGRQCPHKGSLRSLGDLLCSFECFSRYRCLQAGGVRRAAAERDQGVCENCGLDCRDLVRRLRVVPEAVGREALALSVQPHFRERPKLLDRLVLNPVEGNAWHADHIQQVAVGGGECGEENIRTLCVLCHATVTEEFLKRKRGGVGRGDGSRKKKRKGAAAVQLLSSSSDEEGGWHEQKEEEEDLLAGVGGEGWRDSDSQCSTESEDLLG